MTPPPPSDHRVVGVDIGGTRIKAVALQNGSNDVVAEQVLPTPPDVGARLAEVVQQVTEMLTPHAPASPVAATGVALPGLVDERHGMGYFSANLGWSDLPAQQLLETHLGTPVALGHDVRAGLLGEARFGAARGCDDVLFVPLGTGVAGALLTSGQLVLGSEWTGEIGHIVIDPNGALCGCGARGCVETVAGARGLAARWHEHTGRLGGADEVAAAAAAGDRVATQLWSALIDAVGQVVAPVVAAAGTRLVLLGGGVSNAGDQLTIPLSDRLEQLLPHRQVQVRVAELGDRAAALGAAVMARNRLEMLAP
ncbi:MAG: ROK family protein [Nostocoides sp.]